MDSKFHVSLEAARLLKEKGYDEECISYYHDNCREVDYSFCGERNSTWEGRCVSAPTKAEAIDWMESKGIRVEVTTVPRGKWRWSLYSYAEMYDSLRDYYTDYETRLEAEDAAIIKALELL
jgi:hypothetical protein